MIFLKKCAFDMVAIGASAGGLEALTHIFSLLPASFPVPILVVLHRPQNRDAALLPACLSKTCSLKIRNANDGDFLEAGSIYFAPPDLHLIVEANGQVTLQYTEKVSFARPAVNKLFYSTAKIYGNRAIAVVLSGGNSDGANGVIAMKARGSVVLVQNPHTCQAKQMPNAAIQTKCADLVLSLDGIANVLITLTMVEGLLDVLPFPAFINETQ